MDPTGTFRLSRGNKGTLFVLAKTERTTKQDLLDAISEGRGWVHLQLLGFLLICFSKPIGTVSVKTFTRRSNET